MYYLNVKIWIVFEYAQLPQAQQWRDSLLYFRKCLSPTMTRQFAKPQWMPELENPALYNPVLTGNFPHSFTSGYVPVLLKKLRLRRRHKFFMEKLPLCFWRSCGNYLYKVSRADCIRLYFCKAHFGELSTFG